MNAGHTGQHSHQPASTELGDARYRDYLRGMDAAMAKMMADMHQSAPSGNADIDFLAMMMPHHWGAVEMARLVLAGGSDPLVRAVAQGIIDSQNVEIEAMRGRLDVLQSGKDAKDAYPNLDGNRGGIVK